MPKRPRKPKREDFNEAAFRVVREATAAHEPEPTPANPALPEPKDQPADPRRWSGPTEEEIPPPKIS